MTVPYHFKGIEKRWHDEKIEKEIREVHPVFPEDLYWDYGYDAVAVYRLFLHPQENDAMWEDGGIDGAYRFLHRFWDLVINQKRREGDPSEETLFARNRMIFEVTKELKKGKMGTALSSLMKARKRLACLAEKEGLDQKTLDAAVRLLAFFAPFLSRELWERLGHKESVMEAPLPDLDLDLLREEKLPIPVQVNGKKKGILYLSGKASEKEAIETGKSLLKEEMRQRIVKEIYVPGRIISFAVR